MDQAKIFELINRVQQVQGQQLNEAMTRNSLIMPFIQALGYDIFNPNEVVAEYTADFGTKKGEKVDFAIIRDGSPVMMFECKPIGSVLDSGKCSQLYRYFSTNSATKIGILTDGVIYLFFTDLEQANIMDSKPFMTIDLLNFNDRFIMELQKLSKDKWDINSALSSAATLKYVGEIKKIFSEEVISPSDGLIRHFTSMAYDGHFTAKIKDQFAIIVRRAIQEYINDQINARLESAKVDETQAHPAESSEEKYISHPEVVTTDDEVTAYIIIKTILRQAVQPSRIVMRDAKSYCSIVFDDSIRKPVCKLYFNGKKKQIGFFNAGKNEERVPLETLDDIFLYADRIIDVATFYAASDA